ncbi:MAG: class I SAM-dependent methyltransferase [Phenylobacterium sp.]|uniref:class I SAM-dependent methyltransferase n=1 Tax=Phenylobacterium sp. TaxID=1871053 RepID=UPI0025E2D5F6|nr:class I SAM-dependent methyltransferase [Phenylobacterium sp.]MBA4010579.1 class I SAM-dependent methyltransferase [Phenylobacterium sp.]
MAESDIPRLERLLQLGILRLREHFLHHAEQIFRQMLAETPDHPHAQRFLGVTLFKLGRRDEGVELLRQATADPDTPPKAWGDLAAALHRMGASDEAAEAYGRAVHGPPTTPPADIAFATERGVHEFKLSDYPYRATVRYGAGRPPHSRLFELIDAQRETYARQLAAVAEIQADFADIAWNGHYDSAEPFWLNGWFPPLDGMVLTAMLRQSNPSRFVEIGSGVSTKFAHRAVRRYGLKTKLISIDPQPRNEIDALCDQVLRKPLETCDPAMFDVLEPGDIFFLDSSHRAFQGSDVTAFFLDILPRLKPGVIVQIHDIYLPDDYIGGHVERLWNEQYLLAAALLFGANAFEILFPAWYAGQDPALAAYAADLFHGGPLAGLNLYGASFWLRKV